MYKYNIIKEQIKMVKQRINRVGKCLKHFFLSSTLILFCSIIVTNKHNIIIYNISKCISYNLKIRENNKIYKQYNTNIYEIRRI